MRVIKFRGKRIDNGEWVEGYYTKWNEDTVYIADYESPSDSFQVIPETVAQFTGLKDDNGKEIFEGDIVKDGWREDNFGIVEFKEGSFDLGLSYSEYISEQCQDSEIIGNIYENPELLTK